MIPTTNCPINNISLITSNMLQMCYRYAITESFTHGWYIQWNIYSILTLYNYLHLPTLILNYKTTNYTFLYIVIIFLQLVKITLLVIPTRQHNKFWNNIFLLKYKSRFSLWLFILNGFSLWNMAQIKSCHVAY